MTETSAVHVDSSTSFTSKQERKAATAGAIGTVVEWYDYGLYGTASALFIGPLFFSGADPFIASLAAFATFAIGFLVRPLGGIILGRLGDIYGRKPVLIGTVVLMGATTFLMGCLPTYESVGAWAPILLVTLRILQGFGAGAELAGAFTYVSESSTRKNRAFLTSFSSAATAFGIFLGTAVFALMNATISAGNMLAWGWRVPFLASAVIVVVALLIRHRLEDSPEYVAVKKAQAAAKVAQHRTSLVQLIRERPIAFLAGFLVPATIGFSGYVISVYSLSYITKNLGVSTQVGLIAVLLMGGLSAVACVAFGRLADKLGSHRLMIAGAVFSALFTVPFFLLLNTGNPVLIILAIVVGYAFGWGICAAAQGEFLPSLFDTEHRFTGVATTRELSSALLAGPAPFIAAALTGAGGGQPWLISVAVVVAAVLTIIGTLLGVRQRQVFAA
jgi:MHS family shikimate/dehydroshikimate transporter-like MFS transporter